jgi:hypothetical protein
VTLLHIIHHGGVGVRLAVSVIALAALWIVLKMVECAIIE